MLYYYTNKCIPKCIQSFYARTHCAGNLKLLVSVSGVEGRLCFYNYWGFNPLSNWLVINVLFRLWRLVYKPLFVHLKAL
jgi:hypothetical protein